MEVQQSQRNQSSQSLLRRQYLEARQEQVPHQEQDCKRRQRYHRRPDFRQSLRAQNDHEKTRRKKVVMRLWTRMTMKAVQWTWTNLTRIKF